MFYGLEDIANLFGSRTIIQTLGLSEAGKLLRGDGGRQNDNSIQAGNDNLQLSETSAAIHKEYGYYIRFL